MNIIKVILIKQDESKFRLEELLSNDYEPLSSSTCISVHSLSNKNILTIMK